MYDRLKDFPIYETRQASVDASYYNHVEVALKRLHEEELRYHIPGLKHLVLILQHNAWVIVDRVFNDTPVAAWVDFQTRNRANLHEPVKCQINYYHANAPMILRRTLQAMDIMLTEDLAVDQTDAHGDVLPFNKTDDE